jgi:hypothetical protein
LNLERWGSPLVEEKYQEEKACDKRQQQQLQQRQQQHNNNNNNNNNLSAVSYWAPRSSTICRQYGYNVMCSSLLRCGVEREVSLAYVRMVIAGDPFKWSTQPSN